MDHLLLFLWKILQHGTESVLQPEQDYYLTIDTSLDKTNIQYSQQIGPVDSAYIL